MALFAFLKAMIRGGASTDLFAAPVRVAGYTTKDGTYVGPHTAIRRKHAERHAPTKPAAAPVAPVEPAATAAPVPPVDLFSVLHQPEADKVPEVVPDRVPPKSWGVPAGTSKVERRRINAAAVEILRTKSAAEMTAADRDELAAYTGTGGIGDSLNEFYTPPAVAAAMWRVLEQAGFKGGSVLEPSCGSGVFLHTAPAGARVTGVEIDPIAAGMAKVLHEPAGHEISNASLERFATEDGRLFNAVIGNVPFGLRGSTIKDDKPYLATAEGYFIDTALDKTVDGGLVALIVPTGFMDSKTGRATRERVMRKGNFLGAYRMPNTAFEAAHTEVTTDVILFRKRPQEQAGALGTLTQDQLQAVGVWDAPFLAGDYFFSEPGSQNVLGRLEEGWRAKAGMGDDITVVGSMQHVPDRLAAWKAGEGSPTPSMPTILDAIGENEKARRKAISASLRPAYLPAKDGDIRVVDGVRYVLQGEPLRWHRADEDLAPSVADAQTAADLLAQLAAGDVSDPAFTRARMAEALDAYVGKHGAPANNLGIRRWLANPALPRDEDEDDAAHASRVQALRRDLVRLLGAVNAEGAYSDLVTGHQRKADAADFSTLATKFALERGTFSAADMAGSLDVEPDLVLDRLMASPEFTIDPATGEWSTMDAFVAGELWPKFDAATAAAADEGRPGEERRKFAQQAAALEAAINPASLDDVEIVLSSGFITPDDINTYLSDRTAEYVASHTNYSWKGPHSFQITYDDGLYQIAGNSRGGSLSDLMYDYLNRTGVRKDDRAKLDALNTDFADWVRSSPRREEIEERYNRSYKGFRAPDFSDAPMTIPGLRPDLDVNAYHFSGLRWALAAGKGIIADDVGLGKTGRGLMLARLAKASGEAKRPAFVVPKSVMANWVESAEFWFPGSKVLTIGETYSTAKDGSVTSKSDDAATRRRKYQELQQNDYDFVFISQPAWNEIDVDPITKGEYVNSDFWTQRGDKLGNAGDKKLNKIRTAYDQAMAQREFGKREDTIYFGDLGLDMLIMDEGHGYKNLFSARNRFGMSPKFLGGSGESNRAQDTFFKTRQLREQTGGKGVYMLTATPTKNSPLEVYSMLAHIAPETFERMGIKNSEDFIDRFVEFKTDNILNTKGQMEEAAVTAGFKNLGELREVMRRFINRRTAEDVGLVIPTADHQTHMVDLTVTQKVVYDGLREEIANADGDSTGESHIFSVMSRMGKASIDLALLGMNEGDAPKVDAMVDKAVEGAADGGQVVFCDHLPMHEKIAQALVRKGVPRAQIGIINAQATSSGAARQKVTEDFNQGKLKYVIGNTETMGEGLNMQKTTSDIHHLDLPWNSDTMRQRNGRAVRQGNKKAAVRVHTYLAKGSFDGYRYQTILAKKDWQDLLWNGGDKVENLARDGAGGRTDVLIMLSANPDEARAKYEQDKTAALARKQAENEGHASDTFTRLQKMRASLGRLNSKDAGDTAAAQRLTVNIARLTHDLRHNASFKHTALLDTDKPAVIEPTTNTAWYEGRAFTLQPQSHGGPINWSTEPTRFKVTSVDPVKGSVTVEEAEPENAKPRPPWATGPRFRSSFDLDLEELKQGCDPIDDAPEPMRTAA